MISILNKIKQTLRSNFLATEEANRKKIEELVTVQPNARLLDLGCGAGLFTQKIANKIKTNNVTGVDFFPEVMSKFSALGYQAVRADLNKPIPLPSQSFDVIITNQVIEHLYDTDLFLMEISRLLSPNGYCILSTNNLSSWHNIVSLLLGLQPPPIHISNKVIDGNFLDPFSGDSHENVGRAHLRVFSYFGLRRVLSIYKYRIADYKVVGFYPFFYPVANWLAFILPIYGVYLTCKLRVD